jgi:pimeloyl-ACP methyl ester carboxylesterase
MSLKTHNNSAAHRDGWFIAVPGHNQSMGLCDFLWRKRPPRLHVAYDQGSGPTVVLLHGIASSSVTFDNVMPLLGDRYRVMAIDLLGFGQSPSPADASFTLAEHVQAFHHTLRRLKVKGPVVLVGHSLGALIATRYAAVYPDRVAQLVLVAPPVYVPGETIIDPLERLQVDALRGLYDFMRQNPAFTAASAKALSRISPIKNVLDVSEKNWRAFCLSLENCIESQTTMTDIAQVSAPVELIYGTRDPFIAPAGMRTIERMRGVSTHRVEGMDHLIRPKLAEAIAWVIDNPSPPTGLIRLADSSD